MSGTRLTGHGIGVSLPPRWEGRVYLRATPTDEVVEPIAAASRSSFAAGTPARHPAGVGWPGERPHPVLHLANFALPSGRGDFGTGAVEIMGRRHIFIALLEFGSECLGTALYERQGMPRPQPNEFHPATLQRRLPGQAGYQVFFTENGRPMCLFVVIGSYDQRHRLAPQVRDVLEAVEVMPGE